ncbi:MAG: hypothetical protein K5679_02165 [Lachnospiraceae bacterium]|nr:hypothetical protein [Lachnospiraceae bacterium]
MKYLDVVALAKKEIASRTNYCNKHITYRKRCDVWESGNQINLWTYWQGYQLEDIDKNGVDILLVGQDWGDPEKDKKACVRIKRIQDGDRNAFYLDDNSPTDKTLIEMFKVLGCDITKRNPGKRLFFTNYSLGYRDGKETGGMTKKLMSMDSELFDELVNAIHPKIIICLGKLTYEMVSGTVTRDFIKHLQEGNPFIAPYPKQPEIRVYGVAHCGARGLSNIGVVEKMIATWRRIAEDGLC